MTIVSEGFFSREADIGENATAKLVYFTFEEENEVTAHADAVAKVQTDWPNGYRSMPLRGSSIKRMAPAVYEVTCTFNLTHQQTQPSNPDVSQFNTTLAFNLVGGTTHITTALATTSYATGTTVDIKKTIGLDLKTGQIRGVDVFAPVMDYSFATQFPNSVVTNAYVDALFELTGKTNQQIFYRRPIGSVLFKGARGSKRGQDFWEISFEFAYSPNKTGLTVGDITGIDKKGWQYLDVLYQEDAATLIGGKPIQIPAQVNVHTVYEEGDFAQMKIGTS